MVLNAATSELASFKLDAIDIHKCFFHCARNWAPSLSYSMSRPSLLSNGRNNGVNEKAYNLHRLLLLLGTLELSMLHNRMSRCLLLCPSTYSSFNLCSFFASIALPSALVVRDGS